MRQLRTNGLRTLKPSGRKVLEIPKHLKRLRQITGELREQLAEADLAYRDNGNGTYRLMKVSWGRQHDVTRDVLDELIEELRHAA